LILGNLTPPDLIRFDLIRFDLIRFDPIKFDPILLDPAQSLRLVLTQRGNPASGKPESMTTAEMKSAVDTLNEFRNMCGTYRDALVAWQEDNRSLTPWERFEVIAAAQEQWAGWMKQAKEAAR